jgi:hypothetical protein
MKNNFDGTFRFRSNRPYRCTITTNNQTFQRGVVFNSENGNGSWLLMDSLKAVVNLDPEIETGGSSFWMVSGHLHTGTQWCTPGNGHSIVVRGMRLSGGTMSLYDSDVRSIYLYENSLRALNGFTLNSGTSHFIIEAKIASNSTAIIALGNHKYYDVTVDNSTNLHSAGVIQVYYQGNTDVKTLSFLDNTRIAMFVSGTGYNPVPTSANPAYFQKIYHRSTSPFNIGSLNGSSNYPFMVDSLIVENAPIALYPDIYVRSLLSLPGNVPHEIFNTGRKIQLQGATSTTNLWSPCPTGGGPLTYSGAVAQLNGTCTSPFQITGGTFENNSPFSLTVDNATITNNTVTGTNTPGISSNSVLTGTSAQPRKLHWVHSSALAADTSSFQDPNNWEQLLPVYAAAPQCPPTRVDTVLFDNTSFNANNQAVLLEGVTDVASMYWENIPAGQSPKLVGPVLQQMIQRSDSNGGIPGIYHSRRSK